MRRRLLGNEHPEVAASLNNLAGVARRPGRLRRGRSPASRGPRPGAQAARGRAPAGGREPGQPGASRWRRRATTPEPKPSIARPWPCGASSSGTSTRTWRSASPVSRRPSVARGGPRKASRPPARPSPSSGRRFPAGHPHIAEAESILGGCLTLSQRYPEAEALLLGSYAVLEAKLGGQSPEARKALQRIVDLYEAWGRPEQAAEYRAQQQPRVDWPCAGGVRLAG